MNKTVLLSTLSALLLVAALVPASLAQQPSKVLKGGVQEKGSRTPVGLSRRDVGPADAFSDPDEPLEGGLLESPNGFKVDPGPKAPFNLRANQEGNPVQAMQQPIAAPVNPYDGEMEPVQPIQPPETPRGTVQKNNDPDSSPEMQLAWDIWHHRVAEAIYTRFNFLAKLGFKRSGPLMARLSYVVTRDGHIQNIQVQEKSPNVLFNVIVYQTVKSLDGDAALLQYPQGSRRTYVQKLGVFTQNYGGDGFKYTTGDRETIPGR